MYEKLVRRNNQNKKMLKERNINIDYEVRKCFKSLDKKKMRNTMSFSKTGGGCLLYTSPSPRDLSTSRMPSSA